MKNFLKLPAALCLLAASTAWPAGFTLSSPDMVPGKPVAATHILNAFGCTGENKSPRLAWSGAPAGTKSFVLTIYDLDAPSDSGWWHWVVLDIPAGATELPAAVGLGGALPAGAREGRNDLGKPGFMGPCPPAGDKPHRYLFTLSALKVDKLELGDDATPALVSYMTRLNRIAKASFTVRHGR
ncbi:PBP family phospholipid-binding protein [Rubrivivax sp. A210]|uniref:YbhB/YbcL family Raf kinase inhibitor-like protein n=1 Tax=Rubrivivax sp. A210 TaxID=2772301 RepID=UPI00191A1C52|nr:YbhB/YbcL family Raf kinase inhibitor-like protein [Rubrivivax sp. A210]CAD5372756.1 PBP family phospholipid-binding protein [Rubrivivax sp. A210]